jgi:hypothetical protein
LHLELSSSSGGGGVLFWSDMIVPIKNWFVVNTIILTSLVFRSNTLNILTRSHLSSHLLAVLQNWNQHQIKPTWQRNPYIYMTQEAMKTKK